MIFFLSQVSKAPFLLEYEYEKPSATDRVCVCVYSNFIFLCSTQRLFDHPQIVTCFAHVHPQGQVLTTPTKPLETLLDPTTQSNHWGPQAKSVNDGPLSCLTGIPKPRCWCNHWSFWSNFKAFLRRAGVEVVFLFCCHCAVYNENMYTTVTDHSMEIPPIPCRAKNNLDFCMAIENNKRSLQTGILPPISAVVTLLHLSFWHPCAPCPPWLDHAMTRKDGARLSCKTRHATVVALTCRSTCFSNLGDN